MKTKYIVSACLAGELCKYDGNSNYNKRIASLVQNGYAKVICPEVMGGLPTPRIPCEIIGDKVLNKNGEDKTTEFVNGALKSLEICQKLGVKKAILKEYSPSCGNKFVYDGTFSGVTVNSSGVTAGLLKQNGIKVYSEEDEPTYDAIIVCAGSSSRCNLPYNKLFHYNKNGCVIEYAIYNFLGDYLCNTVYLVCKKEEQKLFESILQSDKIVYVEGGNTREESVYNALKLVKKDKVLIHDGARPYVSEELIDRVLDNLDSNDYVVPYVSNQNKYDYNSDGKYIQTPQGYNTKKLLDLFDKEEDLSKYRDESSLIKDQSLIKYINGDTNNTKITVYEDLKEFEKGE